MLVALLVSMGPVLTSHAEKNGVAGNCADLSKASARTRPRWNLFADAAGEYIAKLNTNTGYARFKKRAYRGESFLNLRSAHFDDIFCAGID